MRHWLAAGVGLVAAMHPRAAHAGLAADADAVATEYSRSATVVRLAPRLYGSGPEAPLTLPVAATLASRPGCTTVVALGAVSTGFAVSAPIDDGDGGEPGEQVTSSVAGLAEISRCGASRSDLTDLSIEVRSPHAVVEILVATSSEPLRTARSVLPHREPGNVPPLSRPGPPPSPGALANRVLRLENRFARDEGTEVEHHVGSADAAGMGRQLIELSPGCHRLGVFAAPADTADDGFYDLDAELGWASGGIAAIDRTESPDASLTACTAQRELGIVSFAGAAKNGAVLVVHARSKMPGALPQRWGAAAARIARTWLERHIPAPTSPPVYESLGVGGITILPVELEPGRCYLAAAAPLQGSVKLLALTASTAGVPASLAHVDDTEVGAVVTFCAGTAPRGRLEVEVHGASPIWIAGLWALGQRRLGEEMP
jgi:hypothetical protein